MSHFTIEGESFRLDGEEFKLISGAVHYFRIPREYWRDRLEKAALMGCNAVETYVPWVLHEPRPGSFDFSGNLDIEEFLRTARDLGLYAIVRPGPYICGEFEFGALPWWLLKDPGMRVRSTYPAFLQAADSWFGELLPRLSPYQAELGGPVLMFQIENEYGYYGNDPEYPEALKRSLRNRGIVQPLFTSDGPWGNHLRYGMTDGALQTANFGSGAPEHFGKLSGLQPDRPKVCMEYWIGWFDAWGESHHRRDAADAARNLSEILDRGHVNIYMLHGGTNFGWMSGANHYEEYKSDVTSYDYDAPISERGDLTEKFWALQAVISRYRPVPEAALSARIGRLPPVSATLRNSECLFDWLSRECVPVKTDHGLSMEELDQGFGYLNYRIELEGSDKEETLDLGNCGDRASVFLDGTFLAVRNANDPDRAVPLPMGPGTHRLDVLVENQGRVNFGSRIDSQRKGFRGGIRISNCEISPVEHFRLGFETAPELEPAPSDGGSPPALHGGPALYQFEFELELPECGYADTFFDSSGWGKGVAFVNGFNIGRFWEIGPQRALYIPGPLLRQGLNRIVIFETEGKASSLLRLRPSPDLGD